METKRNLRYFTSKGLSPLTIVALALILVGLIVWVWISTLVGILIAIVGVGMCIFSTSGKASGDDIEYQVGEKIKNMRERGMIRFELFEKSLKFIEPFTLRGYEFNDEVYYKKGSDGKNRTSVFSAAILFFTGEKVHIHRRRFSFVDDLLDEELGGSFKYIDLDHAEVRDLPFQRDIGKKVVKLHDYRFALVCKNGEDALEMSIDYGADVDKLCEDINRIIDIRTKAYYEKLARQEAERKAKREAEAAASSN